MTPSQAIELVNMLVSSYPSAKVRPATVKTYAELLADLSYDECKRAVLSAIAECKFMPTIAEIRSRVAETQGPQQSGDEAWGDVMQAVARFGIYRTPIFSDACTEAAVATIGWRTICNTPEDQSATLRAQFRRVYDSMRGRALKHGNTGRLLDSYERRGLLGIHDERKQLTRGASTIAGALEAVIEKSGSEE